MSAIAGRVLLVPKGNYDNTATYTMLDMVVYNGSSYICKQDCTGVVPTNTTYWMLNASGSAVAYINDIGDVVITNPTNGQVLMYDSATQKWVNGTLSTTLVGLTDTQIASLQNGQVLKYNATSQKWENAEDTGGLLPHLIVISETGSTVKAVKGTTEITATETSTGHFECDVPEFGTWTIHAVLNGEDATVNIVVDTVKVYTVDDSHFHATVTVKYPDGATCRLQSADETLYATGSPYTFTVHHAETYTITVTYNQRIYTDTVTFTTEGQSFSKTLPTPADVDANDINIWLWYGDVSGSYSSLADILADSTALATLMASTDAVDYLVRCKDWSSNDGLVPIMTSATTPSGEASASSEYSSSYSAWKAFDGDTSTFWTTPAIQPNTHASGAYIKYDFGNGNEKNISVAKITFIHTDYIASWSFVIQGSNDNNNWVDISNTQTSRDTEQTIICNNTNAYRYIRIYWNDTLIGSSSAGTGRIVECQFYSLTQAVTENQNAMSYIGLNNYCANTLLADEDWLDGICNSEYFESVLNVKVPVMTSNTTPSGICSAKVEGTPAYRAFNGDLSDYWYNYVSGTGGTLPTWVQYDFGNNVNIYKTVFYPLYQNNNLRVKDYEILSSTDGTNFTSLATGQLANSQALSTNGVSEITKSTASKFRINITSNYAGSGGASGISEIQFYGREDV